MSDSDATAVSNAHPVRVARQRWKGQYETVTLSHLKPCPFGECKEHWAWVGGGGCCTPWLNYATIVSDAPPAVSPSDPPPAGYAPCKKKCGRWTGEYSTSSCWTCITGKPDGWNHEASLPDWQPHAPAKSPDRSGCKAFCGMTYGSFLNTEGEPKRQWHTVLAVQSPDDKALPMNDKRAFCASACRDAKYPPLAPARCEHGLSMTTDCLECATHATPAPVAQQAKGVAPMFCDRGDGRFADHVSFDGRARAWCQPCHKEAVAWSRAQSGTPLKADPNAPDERPELLPRARLAHSMGVECPTLEDC